MYYNNMNETSNIIISNSNNYNNYNKDVNNIIMNLSDYMLNNTLLNDKNLFYSSNKNYEKNNVNSKNKNKDYSNNRINNKSVINKDYYVAKNDEDKLFWCFYKIYDLNNNNYVESNINNRFLTEKNFKISSINKIKNDNILKKLKISKTTIENDLLNEKKISFDTFVVLCNVYELNIFYVKDKIYSKININLDIDQDDKDEENIKYYILYDNKDQLKITFNNQYNSDNYNNIIKSLIEVDNINKPLKNISYYKLKDLQDFSVKLNLPISNDNKKKTKKELYDSIHNLLNYKID